MLTKISDSWVPCFDKAKTEENTLLIYKFVWDSSAPRAFQCTEANEELAFDLSDF